jgi:hypothetical protein
MSIISQQPLITFEDKTGFCWDMRYRYSSY